MKKYQKPSMEVIPLPAKPKVLEATGGSQGGIVEVQHESNFA